MWIYKGGSLAVALLRSGYHTPRVPTEAPVSAWIYRKSQHPGIQYEQPKTRTKSGQMH
jgi:hypothetical protein